MYHLHNVENYNHILAVSADLTEIMAIKLYNLIKFNVQTAIYDQDNDLVTSKEIARYMYHLELNRRPDTWQMILDRSELEADSEDFASAGEIAPLFGLPAPAPAGEGEEVASASATWQMDTEIIDCGLALSDCFTLAHSAVILVPSTIDGDQVAPGEIIEAVKSFVSASLADHFGGSNVEVARVGKWRDDSGQMISEDCYPVNVRFTDRSEDTDRYLINLAYHVKRIMRQQSVYLAIDDKAYFVG